MSSLTEIATRTVIDERLRRARDLRPAGVRHPRHPRYAGSGTRPRVTGPLE